MREADDFVSTEMIRAATAYDFNRIGATLCHFKKHKAAECLSSGDQLWWYLTPETDTRVKHVDERVPEEKGTRNRRRRVAILTPLAQVVQTESEKPVNPFNEGNAL